MSSATGSSIQSDSYYTAVMANSPFETDKPKEAPNSTVSHKCSKFAIRNNNIRCLFSEFLGTFVLVTFGVGTVAQTILTQKWSIPRGNIVTINLGWGLAVTMGIYVAGGISGGHINPAFTIARAVFKYIPWRQVPFYIVGQYLGAFCGAAVVYLVYIDSLNAYDNGVRMVTGNFSTAGIFSTYPAAHVSVLEGFFDQVLATGLLVLMAMAIIDSRNLEPPKGVAPIAIGLVVVVLTTAFESNCGAALNPARDLGPRIFTSLAGWGTEVFSFRNHAWFWVPVLGPHLGAILGAGTYILFVEMHHPDI